MKKGKNELSDNLQAAWYLRNEDLIPLTLALSPELARENCYSATSCRESINLNWQRALVQRAWRKDRRT